MVKTLVCRRKIQLLTNRKTGYSLAIVIGPVLLQCYALFTIISKLPLIRLMVEVVLRATGFRFSFPAQVVGKLHQLQGV